MDIRDNADRPVAVLGRGDTLTAKLLRQLVDVPVVELTPCQAVMERRKTPYRAVIVEHFELADGRLLSGCAAALWGLSCCADITVIGADDGRSGRLTERAGVPLFTYGDRCPRADLSAEQVRLRQSTLEFEALTRQELVHVRVDRGDRPRLYDYLAALAGALALGVPLEQAAVRLSQETEG